MDVPSVGMKLKHQGSRAGKDELGRKKVAVKDVVDDELKEHNATEEEDDVVDQDAEEEEDDGNPILPRVATIFITIRHRNMQIKSQPCSKCEPPALAYSGKESEVPNMRDKYSYYNYNSRFIHHCTISNLQHNIKYFYKLGKGDSAREFWFWMPPSVNPDAAYTFGVIEDVNV
ncbi:hypothetical protein L7F22_042608 [Adiantum nelumboides]|nr:hypothetical protein [Adiantum nelumboides]